MSLREKPPHGLYVAVFLYIAFSLAHPAQAASADGVVTRLKKLEQCMYGKPQDLALKARINQLEVIAFGKVQSGPIPKRLENLEKTIGKSHAPLLPPLAPQLDTGVQKPVTADSDVKQMQTERLSTLLQEGVAHNQSGNFTAAEIKFREALNLSPFNADASFNLGTLAERRGDLASALGFYRTALLANPNDGETREAVGQVEQEIARRQNSPIQNPLLVSSTDNGGTPLLRGSALELASDATDGNGVLLLKPSVPSMATSSRPQIPTLPVKQKRRLGPIAGVIMGAALSAGVGYGLSSVGMGRLHCPACRILGPLRF